MKKFLKKYITAFIMVPIFLLQACDLDETQEVVTKNNLVWADEFDQDGAPNPQNWNFEIGDGTEQGIPGWGNNELQYYTDRPENVKVENGVLVITAREESFQGSNYTSARLVTRGLFEKQYGRFEARIKVPYGKGYWPAFWMLGVPETAEEEWPQIGEIDIMENVGDEPTIAFGSMHGPGYSGGESISKEFELDGDRFDTSFHIFGIEWSPNRINYYIDDKLYQSLTPEDVDEETDGEGVWVFNDRPSYIILNVAVGGNLPGNPNAETIFPQSMVVDYVRVYE
ncbi:glycoside hydrolase family 16 protein [Mesohalobacter halotolerans]|uniref:Glycoside hydrolase family 16 protein n=1 Tax=Mesohalobacter halotolerans TaxID=1883405 RepID=A0A4V6ALD9_9FLAO|nr:glycoside hydrolase family 16 protein [Mesohalobacter halotolerans]MBS3738629.1 glycoside hydrolase family 16 protein [Psychroflexus sp.]TKS56125.1 glycoside hydrolase family 16 protein [Mesohalobacter halotolerans]